MRRTLLLFALASLGCSASDDRTASGSSPCSGTPLKELQSTIHISPEAEAACSVEFQTLVTLQGQLDGVAPKPPVVRGPDGHYLSGTAAEGQFAVWDSAGALVRTVGRGPGEGPGEFRFVNGLTMLDDSLVLVTTGLQNWHVYSVDGDFAGTTRSETTGGVGQAVVTESGSVFGAAYDQTYGVFFESSGEQITRIRLPEERRMTPLWTYHEEEAWYAWYDDYSLRALGREGALVRDNPWIERGSSERANLFMMAVDSESRIWVLASIPDPDAPEGLMPPANSMTEIVELTRVYRDTLLEALSADGRLLVSMRFDGYYDHPKPMLGGGWYTESDDALPVISIVEPVLRPMS